MNELQNIKSLIYKIRSSQVMLDADLAKMYQVETRILNQAVKRNIDRFPPEFMFQLTQAEYDHLISQFVTSSDEDENLKSQFATSSWGGRRKLPFAFTEHGVIMLSAWGPGEEAAAQNMNMKVIHGLATVGLAVDHKAGAVFGAAGVFGEFLGLKKQPSKEGRVSGIHFHDAPDMLFRDHKKVHGRLRVHIMESQEFLVFIDLFGRNLPFDYFAENTVIHDSSIPVLKYKAQLRYAIPLLPYSPSSSPPV
jgi:hypothetical protein